MAQRAGTAGHWRKIAIGALLLPLFWCLFAFIAFVPFNRETSAKLILSVTGAIFIAIVVLLHRRGMIGLQSWIGVVLVLGLMIGLYMVPLRGNLPSDALELNRQISSAHIDRYEYARQLFYVISRRYTGPTRQYLLEPQKIFVIKSISYYWSAHGYVPSHLQAQLYRRLLLTSRRFNEHEVLYKTGHCFNSPHGYVVIRHPARPIFADLWAAENIKAYRFGQLVEMPSCETLSLKGPEGQPYEAPGSR